MTNQNEVERLYSKKELSSLGIGSPSYIDKLVKTGRLKKIKIGANARFKASDVNQFLAEQTA